ncbi:MAG: galactose-1-phosphate uridylyltransferase [Actinomycetota bacterium]
MSAFRKVSSKLFDGRDIHYFDDADSSHPEIRKADLREKADRPPLAELRHDPLTNEWVSVASHRHTRAFLPPSHECPLCPATDTNLSEIPDNFDVAVFENKNPSFASPTSVNDFEAIDNSVRLPLGSTRASIGRCEVVVFSEQHTGSLGTMPAKRVLTVLQALADRTVELEGLPGVKQVFPFENRGQEIGVTLHHPHGQIYSYPYVTPKTQKVLESIARYGKNLFQEILEFESDSDRVVLKSDSFTAYVPFAARWPLELHLLPHRHIASHAELTDSEREELAELFSKILGGFENLYPTPTPYIAAWHQAPKVTGGEHIRLQLQVTSPRRAADRLKYLAGSESAMGAFIADIPASVIASQLREVIR